MLPLSRLLFGTFGFAPVLDRVRWIRGASPGEEPDQAATRRVEITINRADYSEPIASERSARLNQVEAQTVVYTAAAVWMSGPIHVLGVKPLTPARTSDALLLDLAFR